MKQRCLFIAFCLTALTTFSQGSIIMKIPSVTADAGEKIIAYQDNFTYPYTIGSAGAAGKPTFDNIKIKKPQSLSSNLISIAAIGAHLKSAEFDFLDAGNNLIYKISLTEVFVTKFSNLAPECPTCQALTQEIWFAFTTIQYTDPVNNKTFGFDVSTGRQL